MRIKETPTTISMYYQSLMQAYTEKKESKEKELQPIKEDIASLHSDVKLNMPFYYTTYDVQLYDYPEFMENRYIDGTFLSKAKQVYFNKHDGNKLVTEGLNLYTLALKQKDAAKIEKEIELYDKVLNLSKKEHREILQKFYQEVHKHLIMNGEGYVFEGCLGWICINRCHLINPRTTIDYTATRKKKEQLLAEGKRLYNKEEAEWCKRNNIEYNGVDGRVYSNHEYVYEIPLINCRLPNGRSFKLEPTDYRAYKVRGKTNQDLIEECNHDVDKICELPVDIKTKLTMSVEVDKMLYLNFIRNESQKPLVATTSYRKN